MWNGGHPTPMVECGKVALLGHAGEDFGSGAPIAAYSPQLRMGVALAVTSARLDGSPSGMNCSRPYDQNAYVVGIVKVHVGPPRRRPPVRTRRVPPPSPRSLTVPALATRTRCSTLHSARRARPPRALRRRRTHRRRRSQAASTRRRSARSTAAPWVAASSSSTQLPARARPYRRCAPTGSAGIRSRISVRRGPRRTSHTCPPPASTSTSSPWSSAASHACVRAPGRAGCADRGAGGAKS